MLENIKIGISVGDLNGIGLEVIVKSFKKFKNPKSCTLILFGQKKLCDIYLKNIKNSTQLNLISNINDAVNNKLNIINAKNNNATLELGKKSVLSGLNSYNSLKLASSYLQNKHIDAIVTAPIDKSSIRESVQDFIGHTEFLEKEFIGTSLMLMLSSKMKIAFVTGHVPILKVSKLITKRKIINTVFLLNSSLKKDFNIQNPKIAVLGLNPHAGEDGILGDEEIKVIIPAIKEINKFGINSEGPFPADSFFVEENLGKYDGIIAMYHDQGLIPFKSQSFSKGVNFTAGLDITRTSPVHGTAYNIAGKNQANESSLAYAIEQAIEIEKNRKISF